MDESFPDDFQGGRLVNILGRTLLEPLVLSLHACTEKRRALSQALNLWCHLERGHVIVASLFKHVLHRLLMHLSIGRAYNPMHGLMLPLFEKRRSTTHDGRFLIQHHFASLLNVLNSRQYGLKESTRHTH